MSIGIALYPKDGRKAETLLRKADRAMYIAKQDDRVSYLFFAVEMNAEKLGNHVLERQLREGIDRREFRMRYQPQVDLQENRVYGAEALIRWKHPKLGLISPADFLPLAEECGLILRLGEWLLRTAVKQCRSWQTLVSGRIRVAVNVAGDQLESSSFPKLVERVLAETGLDPQLLQLEITENAFCRNSETSEETLVKLHALGVGISIDDFGTGSSPLLCVQHIPANEIKIDRAFVRRAHQDSRDSAIVDCIVSLARRLGTDVVAEGVETAEQEVFLQSHRCPRMQGFRFSPPLPPNEFKGLLSARPGLSGLRT